MCQLVIDVIYSSEISIFFGMNDKNCTKIFNVSADKLRQLIDLFQISSLKICTPFIAQDQFREYYSLIDSIQGEFLITKLNLRYFKAKLNWICATMKDSWVILKIFFLKWWMAAGKRSVLCTDLLSLFRWISLLSVSKSSALPMSKLLVRFFAI